jgi:hypothetical protein
VNACRFRGDSMNIPVRLLSPAQEGVFPLLAMDFIQFASMARGAFFSWICWSRNAGGIYRLNLAQNLSNTSRGHFGQ